MPEDSKSILFSAPRPAGEPSVVERFTPKIAGRVLTLDPREALKTLALTGRARQVLEKELGGLGYALADATAKDQFAPVERSYTSLRGEAEMAALLQVQPWILEHGNMVGAVMEIGSAFAERKVRVLSEKLDAPHPSFLVMGEQWAKHYTVEAQFMPWSWLALVEKGELTITDLLKVPLPKRATAAATAVGGDGGKGQARPPEVFVSYSHGDKAWLERLQLQLKPLLRSQPFRVWVDTEIQSGDEWQKEIENALGRARVAVLLVSVNFLASDFIYKVELPRLLTAAAERGVRILWILLDDCNWETLKVKEIQAAYHDPQGRLVPLDGLTEPQVKTALKAISQKIMAAAEARDE